MTPRPTLPPAFRIEQLASHHQKAEFECGIEALDVYLRRQAGQDARKGAASVFVLVERGASRIWGFYTLSATSVRLDEVPDAMSSKLPKYRLMPAILLGRLAVDASRRGIGLGRTLLADALHRCVEVKEVGWNFVVVDAKDEAAARFYESYRFTRFSGEPRRLLLPRKTVESLF
jgi:GNAT superfamily N-acetyltransferase